MNKEEKEEERVFPPELEIIVDGDTPVEKIIWRVLFVIICLGIISLIIGYLTI